MIKASLHYNQRTEDGREVQSHKLTNWFQFRTTHSNMAFCRYISSLIKTEHRKIKLILIYGARRWVLDRNQMIHMLTWANSVGTDPDTSDLHVHSLYDIAARPTTQTEQHCPYCGNSLCHNTHEQIKLVEVILRRQPVWTALGNDLAVSSPLNSKFHTTKENISLLFVVERETAKCFNLTHKLTTQPWKLPTIFKQEQFKVCDNVLPLQNWCIRSLWRGKCNIAALPQLLPQQTWEGVSSIVDNHQKLKLVTEMDPEGFLSQLQKPCRQRRAECA